MAKRRCKVVFGHDKVGPFAMSVDRHGRPENVINFSRGTRLTARKRQIARRALCEGRSILWRKWTR